MGIVFSHVALGCVNSPVAKDAGLRYIRVYIYQGRADRAQSLAVVVSHSCRLDGNHRMSTLLSHLYTVISELTSAPET